MCPLPPCGMEGIQSSKLQCLSRHRRLTEPGKQGGGTSPSPGNNLVLLFACSVQLSGGKHHCRGSPRSLRGQLHTVQSFLCKAQYEKGGTVRTSSDSILWESHSLSLPVHSLPTTEAVAQCQKPSEGLHYIREAEYAAPLS